MTTALPTFPAPSDTVISEARSGRRIFAARTWMKEARSTLQDGREVQPTMRAAFDITRAIADGMPSVAIAIAEGSYELAPTLEQIAAREEARKLKAERFQRFMTEDCPPKQGIGVCDACGLIGAAVSNHYAPDGMGYPTLVMQQCVEACA